MKKTILSAAIVLCVAQTAGAAGGPDTYGYTWATSADAGGPAVEWIDISAIGTLVTGLADDNAAAAIALPKAFSYYGTPSSSIQIGSNGWVASNNLGNIAACFPTIPTAGGPDGYLAPYMGDLNFTGVGNPGSVRTFYDAGTDRFIVSFLGVPFWNVNSPGWSGSNTFQLTLNYADNSIRFNYLSLSGLPQSAACNDLTVGIENPAGDTGLQVAADADLTAPFSILFSAPATPVGLQSFEVR